MTDENVTIQVNLHAILRNLVQGEDSGPIQLTLPRDARLAELLPLLKLPAMEVVYPLNSTIADAHTILKGGDRVDIIPAISSAALAVGMLAEVRISDHKEAKHAARLIIAQTIDQFQSAFHSINCRDLIELNIRDEQQHQGFIESGLWRIRCMQQIAFAISHLFALRDQAIWDQVLRAIS